MGRTSSIASARASRGAHHFGADPQEYGYSAGLGLTPSCEDDVVS